MEEDLRREIIMDHYTNPINKKVPENTLDYQKVNTNNSSCIDNLDIYLKIEDNIIKDIYFDGEACAISTSSCSIMIHNLIGKTIKEAKEFIKNFKNMIDEESYNEELLGEANAYNNIYKQNNRKHCAYLPYEGILKILDQYDE